MGTATKVASLFGEIGLKDDFTPGLEKAEQGISRFADFSRGAFKVSMGLAAGGLGLLGAGLGVVLHEAMDAEVNIAKLNAVIKSTGGVAGITSKEAQDLADSLSLVTRFSDDAILQSETMLLTFTNIGEDIFPAATEATLNMAEMFGGDATQAAIQLGKALNDPVAGVTALRRVGVMLTDQQEKQIKAFMEVGDVASAQKVILGELTTEFGGLAKAAGDTLSGKMTILKNRALNLAEAFGTNLLPHVVDFVDMVADRAMPVVEQFSSIMGNLVGAFQEAIETGYIGGLVEILGFFLGNTQESNDAARKFITTVIDLGGAFKDFIEGSIIPFIKNHAKGLQSAFLAIGAVLAGAAILGGILTLGGALMALFNPITLIIGGIALLAMAWTEDWGGIRSTITNDVWPALQPIFSTIKDWLEVTIPNAIETLKGAFGTLAKAFWYIGVIIATVTGLIADGGGLTDALRWMFTYLGDGETVMGSLLEFFGVGRDKAMAFAMAIDSIARPVLDFIDTLEGAFEEGGLAGVGQAILDAMAAGLLDIGEWVNTNIVYPLIEFILFTDWSGVAEAAGGILGGLVLGLLDLHTWVNDEIVSKMVSSMVTWITDPATIAMLGEFVKFALESLAALFLVLPVWVLTNVVLPFAKGLVTALADGDVLGKIKEFGESFLNLIVEALSGLPDAILGLITSAIPSSIDLGPLGSIDLGINTPTPTPTHYDTGTITGGGAFGDYVGSYSANEPVMVGTGAQPELFIPGTSGMHYPAGSYGGGKTIVIQSISMLGENARDLLQILDREARDQGYAWGSA